MAKRSHPGPVAEGPLSTPLQPAIELETRTIARELIHPDPSQPRKHADADLRDDLRVRGQLDPITVRSHPEILGEWMIRNGERRWRSSEGVLSSLRCQIDDSDDSPAARLAKQLSHNLGKPLEPLEEARAFKQIADETGMGVADLADFLGRPKSTVGDRLALLDIGPWLELVESGEIPLSHAVKVLVPLRTAADVAHEHAIAFLRKDYRYTRNEDEGEGNGVSLYDFERLVQQGYLPSMYPLSKTKSYGKQPEIAPSVLAKHDQECDCGGILFDLGGNSQRKCCGNPGWWRPLHRAALKAKPKDKSKGRETSTAKVLHLPAGVPVVKSQYGNTPSGVVALTDSQGRWARMSLHEAFDPAELELDPKKLVQWTSGYNGEYPRVGTKDTAAIAGARKAWKQRFEQQYQELLQKFRDQVLKEAGSVTVSASAAAGLLPLLVGELAGSMLVDIAQAFGHTVPPKVLNAHSFERGAKAGTWLMGELGADNAAVIVQTCAIVINLKLKLPIEAVSAARERALKAIYEREIPWKKKPKEEPAQKSAGKKIVGKRQPDPQFMQPQFASSALAVIVGKNGLPRTEITKKLWAYIKKHGLQDRQNRRNINADDALRPVFGGKATVSMFDMTKLVKKHLAGTAEAAALIGTSRKAEKKAARQESEPSERSDRVPLSRMSAQTAPIPGIIDDGDGEAFTSDAGGGLAASHTDDDQLWDEADEEEEELEGVDA